MLPYADASKSRVNSQATNHPCEPFMRVILTTFGTTGDNSPMIAIAEALREQGDEPLLLLNPLYQEAVAARGLPFVPVGPRWDPEEIADPAKYARPIWGPAAVWRDLYLPRVVPTFEAVRQAIREHHADVVVSHWLCFGSHLAARLAGVRNVVVALAPCWWYSREDPSVYSPLDGPDWLLRAGLFIPRIMANLIVSRSLRGICRDLGLACRRDEYFAVFRDAHANLGLWSPTLRAAAKDDPTGATVCGFPWDSLAEAPLGAELQRFLDAGPPPVVVGLGSVMKLLGGSLYRDIGLACRELGCRVVLVGAGPDAAHGLEGVLAVPSAPYRLLFPRARAIVHHGGIGTLAEAMRAGKPMAVVPFANDQYDNARRAHKLGGALRWSRGQLRGGRLRKGLERLLADAALAQKTSSLGATVAAEPSGARVAARTIAGG
jgi:UDP:flavonoid glycosyltransferase YjiC (YdhE family)